MAPGAGHPGARPRRSALYVPAANGRALEKALALDADTVIIDLEDSVAPEEKASAREYLLSFLAGAEPGAREVLVRINGSGTPWYEEDVSALASAPVAGLVLPKVTGPEPLQDLARRLGRAGAALPLWAMIERPLALLRLADIASAAEVRLRGLILGGNDLALELGPFASAGAEAMAVPRWQLLVAARAFGLAALDGVCNAIDDPELLERECRDARRLGYDGKTLVHPGQIAIANNVFSPSAAELDEAEAIVAAFAAPENTGRGVLRVRGRMVERLHLDRARHVLALRQAGGGPD